MSREWISAMFDASAQSGVSESSLSSPPEANHDVPEPRDLPEASKEWKDVHLPIDILLLTAQSCEFRSCLSYLNPGYYKSYAFEIGSWVYFGEMGDGNAKLKVAVIQCNGCGGVGGPAIVVPKAVHALRPKAVICVGYCAGLKEKEVKFGDVIISSKLVTHAPKKVTGDGIIERGVRVPASPLLNGIVKFADNSWKAPLKKPKELGVKVCTGGLLLSGPEVVRSDKRRAELLGRYPDAIALEMEGEGLYAAAHDLGIEWVVIKGVSDYAGDHEPASDWRLFSSLMAASLVAHMLTKVHSVQGFKEWRHYGDK
ncbi:5'-methylthioadenosine/S-adenosylhomocysteine nucleosidase-like isoform X2 [Acropora muricata]|uniref:5'-methylthioadenosine/S-adenosylhomocysteine nucleosidase-like isoform X2 n=1 Tax=Acropora muricata TaxID=159855 RepID=UPI0034E3EE72